LPATAGGAEEIERSIRMVETIGIQKRKLEEENEELKSRISALEGTSLNFVSGRPQQATQKRHVGFNSASSDEMMSGRMSEEN